MFKWITLHVLAAALLALGAATASLGQVAQPAAPTFVIQRATYGAADGAPSADVTEKVRQMVENGTLSMDVDNKALGPDPAAGKPKQLRLEYTVDGKPQTLVAKEGDHVAIPVLPPLSPAEQEAQALAVLKSDAPHKDKADACRALSRVGTRTAVAPLAALLADEKLSHMARYGLETIADPSVDDALRDALGKLKGLPLVGVIGSIGVRRDAEAVPGLVNLLGNADADVAQGAARALGKIGTADAAKALWAALPKALAGNQLAFCEGLFRCAEALSAQGKPADALAVYDQLRTVKEPHQVRTGALRGAVLARGKDGLPLLMEAARGADLVLVAAAARIAMEMPGPEVTPALAAEVAKLPPDRQVLFIDVLGQRADAAAQPALLAIAKSGEKTVRVAAIRALVQIGSASAAPALVQLLGDSEREIAQAAQDGLAALPGNQVDAAVTAMLGGSETSLRLEGIGLVGRRRMTSAMPAILKAAGDSVQQVRLAAIKALGDLAGQAELPALLNLLMNAKEAQDMEAAEQALAAVCARSDEASIEKLSGQLAQAQPAQKCALLRILRTAAGDRALPTVRAAVKDSNAEVHSAAVRILCEWKIAEAAPDLLELAKSSANANEKTLCLRAYIGLAGVKGLSGGEKTSICKQAAAMVQRDAEKKLLLGVLAGITTAESLALVTPYLDTPAIAEEACSAAVTIAEKIGGSRALPAVTAAMQKVVQVTKNTDLANRANAVLKGAPPKPAEKGKGAGKKKK